MKKRQPNQFRTLESESSLTEGAEKLLELIKRYMYVHNVTNKQYAHLMGISLRNAIKYFNELIKKGRIKVFPENRKRGRGRSNTYIINETYPEDTQQT